ncbi:glycosyltransferase family 2 protein [Rhizobium terrae]|uniref:glycosyltransferase family 2 protein n=1 Tax=Rhizobium terrae TaxID=2171756 RepID=UPI000E3E316C|nr:glycosyltransferase family 2 protein [Rhizobium terrae]
MNSIKLSICIPTYNRAPHLRSCLERIKAFTFGFPYEIVISDNASTDNTAEVAREFAAHMPINYFVRAENNGAVINVNAAFRRARGEYAVYLADDDRLVLEGLLNAIKFLDTHPSVLVCHAPWYLYDGVLEVDTGKFYEVEEDVIFPRHSFGEVFNFMYRGHIFPEIAVFRTDALRATWVPRDICFYAFPMLAHLLDKGDVAFLKEPFYKQVGRSEHGRDRRQGGHDIAMSGWDQYRGGLEYFLYFGTKRGQIRAQDDDKLTQEHMCRTFTMVRMTVALRLLVGFREFVKAYEVYTRLIFGGFDTHPEVTKVRDGLGLAAALETLAWQVNAAAEIDNLIISGFLDAEIIKERIAKVNFPERVAIINEPAEHSPEFANRAAVLVFLPEQRQRFVDLGYPPNMVFAQEDLIQTILI